jgi:hypothetical protein
MTHDHPAGPPSLALVVIHLRDAAGRDDVEEALIFAGGLVSRLGEIATQRQGSAIERRKPAALLSGSVVTDVDLDLEQAIDDALRRRFPDDGIQGEEGADRAPAEPHHGRTWVVDPIDGTLNYARRLGPWSVVVQRRRSSQSPTGGWFPSTTPPLSGASRGLVIAHPQLVEQLLPLATAVD